MLVYQRVSSEKRIHFFNHPFEDPPFTETSVYLGKLKRAHYERTLEIIVSKGNHPQMALIQVSE